MRTSALIVTLPLIALLAGCEFHSKSHQADDDSATVTVNADGGNTQIRSSANGVSIDTPGFQGSIKLPGISLGSGNVDLDGMKLYPDSKVTGVAVDASSDKDGKVRISFTSAATPDTVLGYYRSAAKEAGFALASPAAGAVLGGTKEGGKRFDLSLAPAGTGATGAIVVSGG